MFLTALLEEIPGAAGRSATALVDAQPDGKNRPLAGPRFDGQAAIQLLDDALHDEEAHARAWQFVVARCLAAIERLEDVGAIVRGDARPAVADFDRHPFAAGVGALPGAEVDRATGGRVAQGVVQQVHDGLPEQGRVNDDGRQIGR